MLLLKGDPQPGRPWDEAAAAAMRTYIAELTRAGVLLAAEGLSPSSSGVRVRSTGGVRTLAEGPFVESEPLAGYLVVQAKSREEAIEWASRCPLAAVAGAAVGAAVGSEIEVRQVADLADRR